MKLYAVEEFGVEIIEEESVYTLHGSYRTWRGEVIARILDVDTPRSQWCTTKALAVQHFLSNRVTEIETILERMRDAQELLK